mmetsp:Transcript_32383/g.69359  ORF Transcript_32383/g.69359 Transcript_32383/m.69359 type:complete len:150 (+) Transcript_32383:184-633(+)|eukprot:CAMPEP_0206437182 /NCGR_PEP_ID=MMETSP0324_2-20121206/10897_1 /ASSEMBLY_ACC=CAM_ASM_000836 /TAXON_ID=2866 /ORGANISM="Crypthecodinium cohnii, Strain Seligo" /LENGTH=149 /DNA_ID=CAMNT_0053904431 /DNA_START=66 /DNA_END=515 /DNA_ORIENTATION=-
MWHCCCQDTSTKQVDRVPQVKTLGDEAFGQPFEQIVEPQPGLNVVLERGLLENGEKEKIGLDVSRVANGLKIKKIEDGLVKEYNLRNPDQTIQVGDLIVSVNGVAGGSNEILTAISTSSTLDIQIQRFIPQFKAGQSASRSKFEDSDMS